MKSQGNIPQLLCLQEVHPVNGITKTLRTIQCTWTSIGDSITFKIGGKDCQANCTTPVIYTALVFDLLYVHAIQFLLYWRLMAIGYGCPQSHSYFLRVLTEDNWIINSFFANNNKLLSFEYSPAHVHTCKYMHVNRLLYSDFNTLNEISHT